MSPNTPERFREVEPLLNGDRAAAYVSEFRLLVYTCHAGLNISEVRALRDWLTKALPEEKP